MKTARTIIVAICATLLLGTFATAQGRDDWHRGGHPHYRRALSNLRAARAILETISLRVPWYRRVQEIALDIDQTTNEIRLALAVKGERPRDYPPPDPSWDQGTRLQRVSEYLARAHDDVAGAREPNDNARELKRRATAHIEEGQFRTQALIRDLQARREWREWHER